LCAGRLPDFQEQPSSPSLWRTYHVATADGHPLWRGGKRWGDTALRVQPHLLSESVLETALVKLLWSLLGESASCCRRFAPRTAEAAVPTWLVVVAGETKVPRVARNDKALGAGVAAVSAESL